MYFLIILFSFGVYSPLLWGGKKKSMQIRFFTVWFSIISQRTSKDHWYLYLLNGSMIMKISNRYHNQNLFLKYKFEDHEDILKLSILKEQSFKLYCIWSVFYPYFLEKQSNQLWRGLIYNSKNFSLWNMKFIYCFLSHHDFKVDINFMGKCND